MSEDEGMDYLDAKIKPWVRLKSAVQKYCSMDCKAAEREMAKRTQAEHWLNGIDTRLFGKHLCVKADDFAAKFNGRVDDQETA